MSADNGIFIQRSYSGEYCVFYYSASSDESPDNPNNPPIGRFDTLEEAIAFGQEQGTEYGLSFGYLD